MKFRLGGDLVNVCAIYAEPFRDFVGQFNVGQSMSVEQMGALLSIVLATYPNYTPDHFKLFFIRALSGRYGKSYNRIDTPEILNWLSQFDLEFDEELANIRETEASKFKQELKGDFLALKGLDLGIAKPIEKGEIKKREQTPEEKMFQDWIREFDKLFQQNGIDGSIRMVVYNDETIDLNKFLEYKMDEFINENEQ